MNAVTPLELVNLSKLDVLELGSLLPSGSLNVKTAEGASGTHGELATATAVVIVSLAALRVLGVWVAKNNKVITVRRQIEGRDSQGMPKSVLTEVKIDSSLSDPDALKHLAKVLEIDTEGLS